MVQPLKANSSEKLDVDSIRSVSTEIAMPTLAVTKGLLAVWEDLCGLSNELPNWKSFTPSRLGELTPFTYILKRVFGTCDFKIHFMGSAIVQSIGDDHTGAMISEKSSHPSAWRTEIYQTVLNRKEPVFTAVDLGDFERDYTKTECVLLPVLDEAGEATMVVCAAAPYAKSK